MRRGRLSRERFGGVRERVLARDWRSCRACGESAERLLLVHHRQPGSNDPHRLVTLCRGCHVRVHRTLSLRFSFPSDLLPYWREFRRGPEQLRLALIA